MGPLSVRQQMRSLRGWEVTVDLEPRISGLEVILSLTRVFGIVAWDGWVGEMINGYDMTTVRAGPPGAKAS